MGAEERADEQRPSGLPSILAAVVVCCVLCSLLFARHSQHTCSTCSTGRHGTAGSCHSRRLWLALQAITPSQGGIILAVWVCWDVREPPKSSRASGKSTESRGLVGQRPEGPHVCIASMRDSTCSGGKCGASLGAHCWQVGEPDRGCCSQECMDPGRPACQRHLIGLKVLP